MYLDRDTVALPIYCSTKIPKYPLWCPPEHTLYFVRRILKRILKRYRRYNQQTDAPATVVESLVTSLEKAKHLFKRGKESKAIERAAGILRNLDDEANPVEEIKEVDDCPDVMDQDHSLNESVLPYTEKTWEHIINLRYQKKCSLKRIVHDYRLLRSPEIAKIYIARTWVFNFKKKHNLKSRHIDAFVTSKKIESREDLKKSMKEFRENVWPLLRKKYPEKKIWNADQTGLKLESVGLRTITVKGKKKIYRKIQRSSAVTHSLTLHIAISAAGKLFRKTYVVLHETRLPRKFETIRNKFEYLRITNTQSGMMNSAKSIDWMKNTFLPSIPKNSALLLDSWTGFDKMEKLPDIKKKALQIQILPPGTTAELQPLDVYFNRQLKSFNKRMNERIKIYHSKYSISKRENLLSLVNLMMSQFAAPMFQPMLQLAWFKAGYTQTHPPPFVTPATFCFSIPEDKLVCDSSICFNDTFLVCAHCSDSLCFSHSLNHIH